VIVPGGTSVVVVAGAAVVALVARCPQRPARRRGARQPSLFGFATSLSRVNRGADVTDSFSDQIGPTGPASPTVVLLSVKSLP
jgi:hypothetical protein